MASPLADAIRDAILGYARAGMARREIARQTGVSATSVSRVCRRAGLTGQWSRERTEEATAARAATAKSRRVDNASGLLDDLTHARGQLRAAGTPRDVADLAKAVSLLASAHARLAAIDRGDGDDLEHVKSVFGRLSVAFGITDDSGALMPIPGVDDDPEGDTP